MEEERSFRVRSSENREGGREGFVLVRQEPRTACRTNGMQNNKYDKHKGRAANSDEQAVEVETAHSVPPRAVIIAVDDGADDAEGHIEEHALAAAVDDRASDEPGRRGMPASSVIAS